MDLSDVEFEEELSAFDYMMFRADMDARSRSAMLWIETLDAVPSEDRLREEMERASRVVPRLRQHVVAPLLPLAPARWVTDPDFDLDYHVRRISMPAPGDFRHLLDLAQTIHATPLDLGRPLWELTVVEGLDADGAVAALIWKLSHTVTDGVGGMILDQMIRSEEREPDRGPMPPVPVPEDVSPVDLTRSAVRRLPTSLITGAVSRLAGVAGTVVHSVRDPVGSATGVVKTVDELRKLGGANAPEPSPLLARRGLNRRFEAHTVELQDLRAAAKSCGCSVNDAYLAAIGGALRHYHQELGVPVDAVPLGMPVSVRAADNASAGNQWSAITLALPVEEPDPVIRMRTAREQVLTARTDSSVDPMQVIAPVLAWLPQQLLAARGAGDLGIDVQASNVPGHPAERFIAGTKVLRSVPIGPVPGVAMMITMVSVAGRCSIGVNYDTAAVTDQELFRTSLEAGFDEVIAVADADQEGADDDQ